MDIPILLQEEMPLEKNPGKKWSDYIPAKVRVFWKAKISFLNHHNTIIPATKNHTAWVLGAQPDAASLRKIFKEMRGKGIHLVSMLHKDEVVTNDLKMKQLLEEGILSKVDRLPWFDHGTLNASTGKNQTIREMKQLQESFYREFSAASPKTIFYCHCMAGKSRSFVATIAFIYFYPEQRKLFDFENWPQEIIDKLNKKSPGLLGRLKNNPAVSDIAEFVKIQRPSVKKLANMEGDQAGFLGLMSLSKLASDIKQDANIIANRDGARLYHDVQNLGLMLQAPLDGDFRDPQDVEEQISSLEAVFKAYQDYGINLLMSMVIPPRVQVVDIEHFEKYFAKLKPGKQARFAILLRKLEEFQPPLGLGPLRGKSVIYANRALGKTKKLTAGDQAELIKAFGSELSPVVL